MIWLRRIMVCLAFIGLADATYLTVVHYAGIIVLCTSSGNSCEAVQTSVYAAVAGVPVALLGLIGYVTILTALLWRESERTRLAAFAVTFFGFGFSAYLTYREVFSLHEICEWCVSSAVILTLLFILASVRYLRGMAPPGLSDAELELRFGDREYTEEQSATIHEAVRSRKPLDATPLPLED